MKKNKPTITANHSLSRKLTWMNNSRIRVEFKGSCLKLGRVTFTTRNLLNLFGVYELRYVITKFKCWNYTKKNVCLALLS